MPARRGLIEKSFLVGHAVFFEKNDQFLAKPSFPMVLFLPGDVGANGIPHRGAHRKGRIALLPVKIPDVMRLPNPRGRGFFEFAHEIRKPVGCFERNE